MPTARTRTTITLDEDVAQLVEDEMTATGQKFKDVVNDALRRQLAPSYEVDFVFPSLDCGERLVEVSNFNHLASALEDEYLLGKLAAEDVDVRP